MNLFSREGCKYMYMVIGFDYQWRVLVSPTSSSLMNLGAGIISVAPSLSFAHSGASALPRVLALSGSEPVLTLVDIAINLELSGMLVLGPVGSVERDLVWEHLVEVKWIGVVFLDSSYGGNKSNSCGDFH